MHFKCYFFYIDFQYTIFHYISNCYHYFVWFSLYLNSLNNWLKKYNSLTHKTKRKRSKLLFWNRDTPIHRKTSSTNYLNTGNKINHLQKNYISYVCTVHVIKLLMDSMKRKQNLILSSETIDFNGLLYLFLFIIIRCFFSSLFFCLFCVIFSYWAQRHTYNKISIVNYKINSIHSLNTIKQF